MFQIEDPGRILTFSMVRLHAGKVNYCSGCEGGCLPSLQIPAGVERHIVKANDGVERFLVEINQLVTFGPCIDYGLGGDIGLSPFIKVNHQNAGVEKSVVDLMEGGDRMACQIDIEQWAEIVIHNDVAIQIQQPP